MTGPGAAGCSPLGSPLGPPPGSIAAAAGPPPGFVAAIAIAIAAIAGAACGDGAGELVVDGPPMVRQVRLFEHVIDMTTGGLIERRVFAFGDHPLALASEQHAVTTAVADRRGGNALRVIVDELLVGDALEEIECRGVVDDDAFDRVPRGATPDDVARCAAGDDVLRSSCAPSRTSICLCRAAGGCARGGELIAEGQPVGIRDDDLDRAADNLRWIAGAAGIRCGAIDVPIDVEASSWSPSGGQDPVLGELDSLGPAIVLTPAGPLPVGTRCGLSFAGDVVDDEDNRVCIPEGGRIAAGCTPGDVSAFHFDVEAMAVVPSSFESGGTVDSLTDPALFAVNTRVAPASLQGVTVLEGGALFTSFTIAPTVVAGENRIVIAWLAPGLAAETTYTITFPTTVTDGFAQPLPAERTFTFTTGTGG